MVKLYTLLIDPSPNDKIFDWSKLKGVADKKKNNLISL